MITTTKSPRIENNEAIIGMVTDDDESTLKVKQVTLERPPSKLDALQQYSPSSASAADEISKVTVILAGLLL